MQKDFLSNNESIFLNDAALDYNFIPSVIMHRESQQAYIGNSIRLLEQNKNGRNLFIFGSPGIGKTLATKYVLKQVEENSDDILPIYINCWKHDTSYKILVEICNLINYKFTQFKETDILKQRIEYAFVKNVFEKNCIEEIAKKTYEINDVRAGIFLLKASGDISESRSSKKITLDDVNKAINKLHEFKIKDNNDLDQEQSNLLELVKKHSGKSIKDLYLYYNKGVSYRTFRRRLEELKNAKLITLEEKSIGDKGKVAYAYFGLNKKLVEF